MRRARDPAPVPHKLPPSVLATWWALDAYFFAHGYMPTLDELGAARGITGQLAARHLRHLEAAGALRLTHGRCRGIRLRRRPPGMGTEGWKR